MSKKLRLLSCFMLMALPLALPIIASADENPQKQQFHQQIQELRAKLEADRQKLEVDQQQMRADREQMEQLRKQIHDTWEDHREQHEQHASNIVPPPDNAGSGPVSKMPGSN